MFQIEFYWLAIFVGFEVVKNICECIFGISLISVVFVVPFFNFLVKIVTNKFVISFFNIIFFFNREESGIGSLPINSINKAPRGLYQIWV